MVSQQIGINLTNARWLITGGCGFIGTSLIAHLLKENPTTRIRVLDNFSVGTKEDLAEVCSLSTAPSALDTQPPSLRPQSSILSPVELVAGDIRDYEICLACCQGVDIVVHLAANTGVAPSVENPRADMESNVFGIFNLLEAARINEVNKFIFASSGAPIGECEPPIHEEMAPRPVSPYGASKLAGEGYCSAYYRTFGIKTVSLRFGNVYGPRSKHKNSVIAKFFKQALNGEALEIHGDGDQTRDFIYMDDLIRAIVLSVETNTGGEVFQIATYRETTINEIAQVVKGLVESEIGKTVKIVRSSFRLGDVRRNFSDISKARSVLGYVPEHDLHKGMEKTFHYFCIIERSR
ncbi:MAG: NAD-dependent epimerase/dehydratase family protein [Deltaproteobacteria bacterium]|jgi:UDP-glucose 4-epimerase|nr:NAD-dependent epimerase/dehydratase family protein [Deltaproteobacteria bacterium]